MSLIDNNDEFSVEEKKIMEWVNENGRDDFFGYDWKENRESYFQIFEEKENGVPFQFETVAELKTQLESMWEEEAFMKEIAMICSVATFRNRPQCMTEGEADAGQTDGERKEGAFSIPDFVYVF